MDFRDGEQMMSETIEAPAVTMAAPDTATASARPDSKAVHPRPFPVEVDHSRDALLTDFGKDTLKDALSAARRKLSGSLRPRRIGLCRRRRARAAAV